MQKPSIGRIVLYVLSQQDCDGIEASRQRLAELLQISAGQIGNSVRPGEIVPLLLARVWDEKSGCCNGRLMVDGADTGWVTSRYPSEKQEPGTWHWPAREGRPGDSIHRLDVELCSMPHPLGKGAQINPDPEQFATLKENWGPGEVPRQTQLMRALYDGETMARVLLSKLNDLPTNSLDIIKCRELAQQLLSHAEAAQITPPA